MSAASLLSALSPPPGSAPAVSGGASGPDRRMHDGQGAFAALLAQPEPAADSALATPVETTAGGRAQADVKQADAKQADAKLSEFGFSESGLSESGLSSREDDAAPALEASGPTAGESAAPAPSAQIAAPAVSMFAAPAASAPAFGGSGLDRLTSDAAVLSTQTPAASGGLATDSPTAAPEPESGAASDLSGRPEAEAMRAGAAQTPAHLASSPAPRAAMDAATPAAADTRRAATPATPLQGSEADAALPDETRPPAPLKPGADAPAVARSLETPASRDAATPPLAKAAAPQAAARTSPAQGERPSLAAAVAAAAEAVETAIRAPGAEAAARAEAQPVQTAPPAGTSETRVLPPLKAGRADTAPLSDRAAPKHAPGDALGAASGAAADANGLGAGRGLAGAVMTGPAAAQSQTVSLTASPSLLGVAVTADLSPADVRETPETSAEPDPDTLRQGLIEARATEAAAVMRREGPALGLSKGAIQATAQIAAQILKRLDGRSTRFDMALTPDSLGRVDVRLEIDADGALAARLAFDNPAAAAEMRGRADELRRQLEDAGFRLAEDALQFSERDSSGRRAFDDPRDRAFAGARRLNDQADEALAAAPARWTPLSLTPERVDLKV